MQTRPVTTVVVPAPQPPAPGWQGLFREPMYADGLPYQTTADDQEDEDDDPTP